MRGSFCNARLHAEWRLQLSIMRNIDAAGNDKQLTFRSDLAPDELPWDYEDSGESARYSSLSVQTQT